jgi:hypothetical protein
MFCGKFRCLSDWDQNTANAKAPPQTMFQSALSIHGSNFIAQPLVNITTLMQDANDLNLHLVEAINQNLRGCWKLEIASANIVNVAPEAGIEDEEVKRCVKRAHVGLGMINVPLLCRIVPNVFKIGFGLRR